ncbi:MAG: PAS domain S-box protein [Chlorobi bacterium]|nr:PAS domain S-box protein [Chlorobiota bacterium]MCI0714923.1 PAS domain S-box protein [Chlorobiota bacterium]
MEEELNNNIKESTDLKDIVIIFSVIILILVAASMLDIFVLMRNIAADEEGFRIVELLFVLALFAFAYAIYSRRRVKELKQKILILDKEIEDLKDNVNRLRSTVDLSPDTITVHRDGKLLFVNKAGLSLFGAQSEEQLIGMTVKELLHFSYWDKVSQRLESMTKYMKQVPAIDVTIKRIDGSYIDVSVASTPVLYHSIPHVITIIRDITERKKNEEIKSHLAAIVLNSSDAIYAMSLDGQIQSWNPGAEKLYGFSEREAIGRNISIVIPVEKKSELNHLLNKISKGERIESYETKRQRKDKSILDVSLTISPIRDESGLIAGASAISRDITYKKQVEEELRIYAEELALSNEELYVFSYAASHDLQEPLRSVQNFIETLNKKYKKRLGHEMEEEINSAEDGVTRMYRLITDFLMYSRVGTEKATKEEIDCNHTLKDAISNLEVAIKESKTQIKQYTLPKVWGNFVQITQVFQNLIANAIKYQGDNTPVIEISAEKKNGMWQFAVKDNGIGIEQWFSERIFIVFQKLHDHRKYPGSGIGLALCKRVIEKHGGKIWFESEVGKGTTFYFTIPILEEKKKIK